jgi:hypothetical protein
VPLEDPEDRELCSDDLCTGVIGDDGRCGVCGRPREGEPLPRKKSTAPSDDSDDDVVVETGGDDEGRDADEIQESAESAAYDPDERVPCPDDLCTGIMGPDGRCGTCGRRT